MTVRSLGNPTSPGMHVAHRQQASTAGTLGEHRLHQDPSVRAKLSAGDLRKLIASTSAERNSQLDNFLNGLPELHA
jgi:hypothetical protein